MKRIIVASKNPVKIQATLLAFKKMFPNEIFKIKGIDVDSQVKDQPMSDKETFKGAFTRANSAKKKYPQQHFWVGLEGGIEKDEKEMQTFAWVVVLTENKIGKSRTATFILPAKVAKLINQGKELGQAMDEVFHESDSKQKQGAIGILTNGVTNRKTLYTQAVINALIPIKRTAVLGL